MKKKGYKIIVCCNTLNVIGDKGNLIYHIKKDMENFKKVTMGNVVIMGRKTFESLPNKKPLKGRVNIVLTQDKDYYIDIDENNDDNTDLYICHTIEDADDLLKTYYYDLEWFVIGGSRIYSEYLDRRLVSKIYMTLVYDDKDGDTRFPIINRLEWRRYDLPIETDEEKQLTFSFKRFVSIDKDFK